MFAFAIPDAAKRPLVTKVSPQSSRLGFTAARRQYRHRRVVAILRFEPITNALPSEEDPGRSEKLIPRLRGKTILVRWLPLAWVLGKIDMDRNMKIAFVNQPIDTILPPYQTSVGACTYGAANSLAKFCEVVAYGTRDRHKDFPPYFRKQDVHFRFLSVPRLDRLAAKAKAKYCKIFPLCSPNSSSEWPFRTFARQVGQDLRLQACDVIQVQQCSQYIPVIRALNPSAKIVLQLHAEWFSQNRPRILEKRLHHVDLVTTVSDYITEKTRRQFPIIADRCQTIYNAVDVAEFRRSRDYDATSRQEKRILYAGAVSPHKGVHVLLDAFSTVVMEYPNVRLDVVGPEGNYPLAETFELQERELIESISPFYTYHWGPKLKAKLSLAPADAGTYLADLKRRMSPEASRKVAFRGFIPRPELVSLYYDTDVFAFAPIWNEGFGIPPIEAMAAGVPVVASRSGAIPEMVRDQETGLLVNKNDPRQLADSILRLLNDDNLRAKMGRAARRWVHENFVWDKIAEKIYNCYSNLHRTSDDGRGQRWPRD
jgi:glycosyltransferase involved in cell wall biosynthesis